MFLSHNFTTPKLIQVKFCDRRRSQKIVIFGWMLLLLVVVLLVILATLLLGWACFGFCRRARNECNADNAADEFYSEPKPKAALPPPTAHRVCLCHCAEFQLQLVAPVALSMKASSTGIRLWFVSWLTLCKTFFAPTRLSAFATVAPAVTSVRRGRVDLKLC